MKLTTGERLNLGGALPREGDWMTLTTVREIQKKILITLEELQAVEYKEDEDGRGHLNPAKDTEKEIGFTSIETKVITDKLVALEGGKKLPLQLMSLYEKFVVK